jgi:GWxTD domain-containing protein
VYRNLELTGKARFLEDFWRSRDPDPSTALNEFQREHLRRWNFTNQQFSRFRNDDGWKTDRGRVYIIWGPPDDIERHPADISNVAWERWHYYSLEGGIEFIFADLSGFENYVQVHSTAKGEYRDPNWLERMAHMPMGP